MDSMHPDPAPQPPPSLADIRAHVSRLEDSLRAKNHVLSGRIIHVCHHLPVEITRLVPAAQLESGVLNPPMTPEFKPEDDDPGVESHDAKWRIHSRSGHTAMVSGMRSLSASHEQIVVAWTGDVLLQSQTAPSPRAPTQATFSSLTANLSQQATEDGAFLQPGQTNVVEESGKKVFNGEFSDAEKEEIEGELDRFSVVEGEAEQAERMKYVPVFLPPDVSKGHYEGFCKKSECGYKRDSLMGSSMAAFPLPPVARLHRHCPIT